MRLKCSSYGEREEPSSSHLVVAAVVLLLFVEPPVSPLSDEGPFQGLTYREEPSSSRLVVAAAVLLLLIAPPRSLLKRAPRWRLFEAHRLEIERGAWASPRLTQALRRAPERLFKSLFSFSSTSFSLLPSSTFSATAFCHPFLRCILPSSLVPPPPSVLQPLLLLYRRLLFYFFNYQLIFQPYLENCIECWYIVLGVHSTGGIRVWYKIALLGIS
ncbi:hypothetical protein GW17_00003705 [Ensete ventricosum]|nr:hypothetical protein GW17_00003705 [Ensete ventricosum]